MTTERRGLFVLKTSEDGTKCAAECPHTEPVKGHWCDLFGPIHGQRRPIQCTGADFAAREAEVDALQRGYGIAESEAYAQSTDHCGGTRIDWSDAADVLGAEIERIRGGR